MNTSWETLGFKNEISLFLLKEKKQKAFSYVPNIKINEKILKIVTCLCGRVVSKIHLSTLILTCLWTSKRVLTKSLVS